MFQEQTKIVLKKRCLGFAERLLSTKLITLVLMWVAGNIWIGLGKISGDQWVTMTLGIGGLIVAASYVDKKMEQKNVGNITP